MFTPRLFLEAWETGQSKSLAPLAHDLARRVQACGKDVVGQTLGSQEHDFRSDDVAIRRRIFARSGFEFILLVSGKDDVKWA